MESGFEGLYLANAKLDRLSRELEHLIWWNSRADILSEECRSVEIDRDAGGLCAAGFAAYSVRYDKDCSVRACGLAHTILILGSNAPAMTTETRLKPAGEIWEKVCSGFIVVADQR